MIFIFWSSWSIFTAKNQILISEWTYFHCRTKLRGSCQSIFSLCWHHSSPRTTRQFSSWRTHGEGRRRVDRDPNLRLAASRHQGVERCSKGDSLSLFEVFQTQPPNTTSEHSQTTHPQGQRGSCVVRPICQWPAIHLRVLRCQGQTPSFRPEGPRRAWQARAFGFLNPPFCPHTRTHARTHCDSSADWHFFFGRGSMCAALLSPLSSSASLSRPSN